MKKLLFVLFSLFLINSWLYSQICGVPDKSPEEMQQLYNQMNQLRQSGEYSGESSGVMKKFKVHFTVVRDDSGVFEGVSIQPNTQIFNAMLNEANQAFLNANIEFEYCGAAYIDNSNITDLGNTDPKSLTSLTYHPNAINVYIIKSSTFATDGETRGFASPPNPNTNINFLMVTVATLFDNSYPIFIHEMGHIFDLPHTHRGGGEELVNGSNCTIAGDGFCDTPADNQCTDIPQYNSATCVYTGSCTDDNNVPIMPDLANYMGYKGICKK